MTAAPETAPDTAPDTGSETGTAAADLFFGLSAIIIVLICLLSQGLRHSLAARTETADHALLTAAASSGLWLAVAGKDGVDLSGPGLPARFLPTDSILSGGLGDWPARGQTPWVVITPAATDSAFLLDTALAQAGIARLNRIRLDRPCNGPRFTPAGLICDG